MSALLVLILFIVVERRGGDQAMMPLSLFASKSFVGLTLLTLTVYGALGSLFVLIPYFLIEAAHYSGIGAGAALLPLPLVLSVASPLLGSLAARIGPKLPLTAGPLIIAAGFLLALRIDASANYWTQVIPAILVIAIGMSGVVAPLTDAVLTSADARHTGSASGFNSAVARTGGLIGTALLGSVFAAEGPQLVSAFLIVMLVGAVACIAASASALLIKDAAARTPRD
jgi:predicted MFS family arabinose efflux permease